MKLVFILPTYNERDNILPLLTSLRAAMKGEKEYEIAYLVVDDNSPDGTKDVVMSYQKKNPDVYMITGKKEGLGKALLRGMAYAVETLHADILFQMDADLSHDPKVTPVFLKEYKKGADIVVGSRYIKGGSIPDNWGLHRKLFSVAGNLFVRLGLGQFAVHDWTGGFRIVHKRYFLELHTQISKYTGYVFQIALLHKAVLLGARVTEVPIHFSDRRYGRSKIAPLRYIRNIFEYIYHYRVSWLIAHPFSKFAVVGTIGFIINTILLELAVFMGFHPVIGSIVGAEVAIISNFLLNNVWTFRERKIKGLRKLLKFVQFNITSVGAILIQGGSVFIGTHMFGVEIYRVFYVIGVLFGLLWNYFMYSRVIWRKR